MDGLFVNNDNDFMVGDKVDRDYVMKFKDLENAVCGETVLIDKNGRCRTFVVILESILITFFDNNTSATWFESEIKDWKIKKPEFKPEKLGRLYMCIKESKAYNSQGGDLRILFGKPNLSGVWKPITVDENGDVWSVEDE